MALFWKRRNAAGRFSLARSIELGVDVSTVFECWGRYEEYPKIMENVRRIKRIDEDRVLFDVDVLGHQLVWEARVVDVVPEKVLRWESSWGARNAGRIRFEALAEDRARLTVEIEFEPRGFLENLGARIGLPNLHLQRDLASFRRFVESPLITRDASPAAI